MSLLKWFKPKAGENESIDLLPKPEDNLVTQASESDLHEESNGKTLIEIPEDVFVEYQHPTKKNKMEVQDQPDDHYNLKRLYAFLDQNLEKKGYEDALVNPDTSYMNEHLHLIQNELNLLVSRIQCAYREHLNQIDFHIETRKRSGMVETVEELLAHKKTVEQNVSLVSAIHDESKRGEGVSQSMILSYKKGFRNGFAAITFNTILNKSK